MGKIRTIISDLISVFSKSEENRALYCIMRVMDHINIRSRQIFILFALSLLPYGMANAIDKKKMSATTMRYMQAAQESRAKGRGLSAVEEKVIGAFVHISDAGVKSELEALGVVIDCDFDEFVTAKIPVSLLEAVLELEGVTYVNAGQKMTPACDTARMVTKAIEVTTNSNLAKSAGLTEAYTGKGVIAGVIDVGIDFNHIVFYDKDGNCRIKRAYLDGSYSNRPDTLTNAATATLYHGTTTSSTLGGSPLNFDMETYGVTHANDIQSSSWSGMAPDVDFFLCETNLSNVEVVNLMKSISDYAYKEGKPCVISCSFGIIVGPHDGTGEICAAVKKITRRNDNIVLEASGNTANLDLYAYKKISRTDSLNLIFCNNVYSELTYCKEDSRIDEDTAPYMGLFARDTNTQFTVQTHIFRVDTLEENHDTLIFVYDSPIYDFDSEYSLKLQDKKEYAKYFNGYLDVEIAFDENNDKYYSYIRPVLLDESTKNFFRSEIGDKKYGMMVTVRPKEEDKSFYIDAWASNYSKLADEKFLASGVTKYGVTTPSKGCTVCTENTTDRIISVGDYNIRNCIDYSDKTVDYTKLFPLGDISYFSNYALKDLGPLSGTDEARDLPDITAPATFVLGAVTPELLKRNPSSTYFKNEDYPFEYKCGTSLSCPIAAGIIALWLQAAEANGLSLGVDDIRSIIEKTADKDEYTTDADGNAVPAFGPNGKINALKGIVEILKMAAEKEETTKIAANKTAKPIKEVFYVNINGSISKSPFAGEVNLKVTRYTDSTESVVKIML